MSFLPASYSKDLVYNPKDKVSDRKNEGGVTGTADYEPWPARRRRGGRTKQGERESVMMETI